ncbi:MAG: adenosylcobinamide-GDP ribazoletransferase [Treponema sp.]|nr:adenosylcobinamide-GDP ribazoletransferase [Treponema sp.]
MIFLKSFVLAFSMFSKIPMPRVEWSEKNMRYMMCAFPFVGLFLGCVCAGLCVLKSFFAQEWTLLFPLLLVLAPILVTGGIHIDGFMDTCDALGSHAPKEKKLEILKDSHVGSFAVLGIVLYLLCDFVLCFEFIKKYSQFFSLSDGFDFETLPALIAFSSSFMVSRFLSALSVCVFPKAKGSGLARTFSDSASRKITLFWCVSFLALIFLFLVIFCKKQGVCVVLISLAVFAYYFFMSRRNFGGITGDLAGWFVQICEILCLLGVCIV